MIAAGVAHDKGLKVIIIEKMKKPCLKLGITGKGRCNLTNIENIKGFLEKFGMKGTRFLKHSLYTFDQHSLISFFNSLNIDLITERGGRVFPKTGKALSIVGSLKDWIKNKQIKLIVEARVKSLIVEANSVVGIEYTSNKQTIKLSGKAVILATGGKSYPLTGSTGDGYLIAKDIGHKIEKINPSLVPIETETEMNIAGLSLKNIEASVILDNKYLYKEFGELLFMEHGISGPVILTMSKNIVEMINKKQQIELSIDLKPALTHKKLDNRLLREFIKDTKMTIENILRKLLPFELIETCLKTTKIAKDKTGGQISAKERKQIRLWLKDFRIKITGYRPIEEAIITSGGINLKEVNSKTMESKIIKNLYFAGEVLDIDAKTGGYNLQAAFSTGFLAGISVALKNKLI